MEKGDRAREERARVLVTGLGIQCVEALEEQMAKKLAVQKSEKDFVKDMGEFRPHIVVICLQKEPLESMGAYQILENDFRYANTPVIVVGEYEECQLFQSKLKLENVVVMEQPLHEELFLSTLSAMANETMVEEALINAAMAAEGAGDGGAVREGATLDMGTLDEMLALLQDSQPKKPNVAPVAGVKSVVRPSVLTNDKESAVVAAAPVRKGKQTILVVDDDPRMLNVLKMHLEELYEVVVVPSGKLALKYLGKRHADLVLLDYLMPEMDGGRVLQEIRANTPNPTVPVIFLTGVADKRSVVKTLEMRPNGYLLKPITKKTLLERVAEVLLGI